MQASIVMLKVVHFLSSHLTKPMKVFFLLLILMQALNIKAQETFTFPSLVVEYDSALIFRNLKLILIKRVEAEDADTGYTDKKIITLKKGLQKSVVKIKERGNYMVDNINVLLIENNSSADLIIRSGEIAMGGRQDRVFAKDTIIPPGKTVHTIPVYCIEENRWSGHEKKFVYGGNTSSGLQKIIDSAHNQTKIWNEIRNLLKSNNQTSSSSFAALLSSKKTADTSFAYIQYFFQKIRSKDSTIVGLIASTGTTVLGADVFVSPSLFYQTLGNLLEKYGIEAVLTGSPPSLFHEKEKLYAGEMLNQATQPSFLQSRGKRFYYKGVLIQITGY
jgi:hypothetical protein